MSGEVSRSRASSVSSYRVVCAACALLSAAHDTEPVFLFTTARDDPNFVVVGLLGVSALPPVASGRLRSPPVASGRLRSTSLAWRVADGGGIGPGALWVGLVWVCGEIAARKRVCVLPCTG